MRYYLDTNMLIFLLSKQFDEINSDVRYICEDYSNILLSSSIAVIELLLLYRIGKLWSKKYKSEKEILDKLKEIGVDTIFFNQYHLSKYSALQIASGHKDMNDHAIIAQSIADKIPIISSDRKFKEYTTQGLSFVYNKR